MSREPQTAQEGPWTAVWHGGRLADISHAEREGPIACVEVGEEGLEAALEAWARESGPDYIRELPWL